MYAKVVFALPFRKSFTYKIPKDLSDFVVKGVRVVAPFGRRVLTGFVVDVSDTTDVKDKIKPLRDVLDELPIFDDHSLKFYEWIADYYLCSLGEALRNSTPYGSEVESRRKIVTDPEIAARLYQKEKKKTTVKAKLLKALSEKDVYTVSQLQKQVKKKNIYSSLRSLEKIGAVSILDVVDRAKVGIKKVKHVRLAREIDEIYRAIPEIESRSPKQVVILLELMSSKEPDIQQSELLKSTKSNQSSINSLVKKNLVEVFDKEIERVYSDIYTEEIKQLTLSQAQSDVISKVEVSVAEESFKSFLLFGVTGSGKTQVYIELAKMTLEKGKSVLILVPEISLTPQITSRFYNNFGGITTVMHSRMSPGERYDSWRGILKGKYKVVIGPRSALFAPLQNTGLIVVDEEHDSSYKQYEMIPKYHARDAAVIKASINSCPVILGSATPSVESRFNAEAGKYELLELKKRVDNAKLPKINLIDATKEKKSGKMENVFSAQLVNAIAGRLKKKESVILLQNRRGFSTQVYCEDCGSIVKCIDCDVSLVHHISKNIMQCHYCGFTQPIPKACPVCGSLAIKFFGTGTQKVEDELAFHFPGIKIERVDSDTITRKGKLGMILNSFRKGDIDVLVGTQMVSKGLDFSNVTLVGVISAETTLWLPDFRADERTFQLLTQVAGRSGRSVAPGEVIIQTQNPKHFVLQKVLEGDYPGFYKNELMLRKAGFYPPFSRLALIEIKDENESNALGAINEFYKFISAYGKQIDISAPTPALIPKIKKQYRYHLLIKSGKESDPGGKVLRTAIENSLVNYNQKSRYRNIKVYVDIDVNSIM
jgi:primosomal protein N' (replication factor Y)